MSACLPGLGAYICLTVFVSVLGGRRSELTCGCLSVCLSVCQDWVRTGDGAFTGLLYGLEGVQDGTLSVTVSAG